jgi:hypothetical protein
MKILKEESSLSTKVLAKFVNDNNIAKEDIIAITSDGGESLAKYTIFFYGDSEVEQKIPGIWG